MTLKLISKQIRLSTAEEGGEVSKRLFLLINTYSARGLNRETTGIGAIIFKFYL